MAGFKWSTEVGMAVIGHGGCSLVMTGPNRSTTSGYDRTPAEVAATIARLGYTVAPGAVLVDLTVIPADVLVPFAVRGPMVDLSLPAGTVQSWGSVKAFDPTPGDDSPWRGNAGGLDYVSPDVYVTVWSAWLAWIGLGELAERAVSPLAATVPAGR